MHAAASASHLALSWFEKRSSIACLLCLQCALLDGRDTCRAVRSLQQPCGLQPAHPQPGGWLWGCPLHHPPAQVPKQRLHCISPYTQRASSGLDAH